MSKKIVRFILNLLVFVLVISFIMDKVIYYSLNKLSDNVMTGQSIGKLNQFLSIKDSVNFIVLGNSRANHHIDTKQIDTSSFNMGIDGTGIAYINTLTKCLADKKKQFVLIHIDTKDFFDLNYNGDDLNTFIPKYNRNQKITLTLKENNKITFLNYFYFTLNYNNKVLGIIKNFIKPNYDHKMYYGFDPLNLTNGQKIIRDKLLTTTSKQDCSKLNELNSFSVNQLKEIKKEAKNSNKTYLFVTSPIFDDNCIEDNIKLKELMKNLDLNYWDFSNLFKETQNKNLWKDETHLSITGAEKFTRYLNVKLNEHFDLK